MADEVTNKLIKKLVSQHFTNKNLITYFKETGYGLALLVTIMLLNNLL